MVMTASTTVVVTVGTTLRVTNRLDIVTGDVTRDSQMCFVAKNANLDIMELGVETFATVIV